MMEAKIPGVARMSFLFKTINSVFCDFYSEFLPGLPAEFLDVFGLKWPDDFDGTEYIGKSRFQFIHDFKSGACLFNHEGTLHPFTERKILERKHKIRESFVVKRFGERTPFRANNVYFLETGFNLGEVEFMTFEINKEKFNSFESYRKIVYSFPFYWLLNEVVALKEISNKKKLTSENIIQMESDRIIKHKKLEGWQFMERDILPCADEYIEKVERPLHNYYFVRDDKVHVWLEIEFF
jgi:hypothetical protein